MNESEPYTETWHSLSPVGFSKYYISTYGRIKDKFQRIVKPAVNNSGYAVIILNSHGVPYFHYVDFLVATIFVINPDPKNKIHVWHINRVKTDNRPQNLRWSSRKQEIKTKKYKRFSA